MANNSTITKLDTSQAIKRVYEEETDTVRVNITAASSFNVDVNATAGDSVLAVGTTDGTTIGTQKVMKLGNDGTVQISANGSSTKASITTANTGVIIAATSCVGMKSFNLYTNTTSTMTGAQAITVEVSPSDTDNVWIATTLTATPSTVNATVVMGTNNVAITARRVRVSIAAAISTGTFDAYLVMQGI